MHVLLSLFLKNSQATNGYYFNKLFDFPFFHKSENFMKTCLSRLFWSRPNVHFLISTVLKERLASKTLRPKFIFVDSDDFIYNI